MPRGVYERKKKTPALPQIGSLKVHIYPFFSGEDKGDGGIRRVVEAQQKHLPKFNIEVVDSPEDADVIACHATVPESYIKRYPRKAFVAICHGLYWDEYSWENWSYKANANVIENIRNSDAVIAHSDWVANNIRRHTSRNVDVIPLGIDIEDWTPLETMDYVLWNKTRPDPVCDPEPMNKVAEIMPEVMFASTFGDVAPNVKIVGRLPYKESKEIIQHAGVYLATTRETFGIGTIEALSCGVPVVGFDWGGQSEFINHMYDGFLATPGDIAQLAEGIRWAFENRNEISPRCIEKAKQFTNELMAERMAEVFRRTYDKKNQQGPRTTIIVTNYNLHDYLEDCLNSVASQNDSDWECIVVDDASPNNYGVDIARRFADSDDRFKVVVNGKNEYLAEARNIGIRAARGRYILPLDADDMLSREAVRLLADALDGDRSIAAAYGRVFFVDEDGVTPTDYQIPGLKPGQSNWPYQFSFKQQAMQRNMLPYSSMFRKEAWEQTGGYRRRCRTAEDADFWLRISSYGFTPKMVTQSPTLIYRNREGSMSRTNSADWSKWFPWSRIESLAPAGSNTESILSISSLDPVVVSVIIPVGPGHEKIVTDAIDSVESQTFVNWECIVVNDTGAPLPTELPVWVKVIDTPGRVGTAAARNIGIRASKGNLFLPLDADDFLEPFALKFMMDAYAIDGGAIYSDFWQTTKGGSTTVHHCDDYDPRLLTGKARVVEGKRREGMVHSVTVLTPKRYWEEVGGYDEEIPGWEDWDFSLAIADRGHCSRRVAFPLFTYRKDTGYRREENYGKFDESKKAILQKWGRLWEGGKELMACTRCGSRPSHYPNSNSSNGLKSAKLSPQEGAMLVRYVGDRQATTPYKAPSGTVYWFGKSDAEKYVLGSDAEMFKKLNGFEVVLPMEKLPDSPALSAEGQVV